MTTHDVMIWKPIEQYVLAAGPGLNTELARPFFLAEAAMIILERVILPGDLMPDDHMFLDNTPPLILGAYLYAKSVAAEAEQYEAGNIWHHDWLEAAEAALGAVKLVLEVKNTPAVGI